MIASISGTLAGISNREAVLLQREGFSYEVYVPAATIEELSNRIGQTVTLHTLYYLEGSPSGGNLFPRLVGFATSQDKEALGVDLLAMNQDAVMQRYPESDANNLPGPINPQPYKYTGIPSGLFEAYELIGSFLYQCSEGNVPNTELYAAIQAIYNSMAHNMARAAISGEYR